MGNWFKDIGNSFFGAMTKLKEICKETVDVHTKACIIAGCIAACGIIGLVAVFVHINSNNNSNYVIAAQTLPQETEPESITEAEETQKTTAEETASAEGITETEAFEDVAPQDMNEEQIVDMLASGTAEIIEIENLEVGEDDSQDTTQNNVEISDEESQEGSSSDIYEISDLVYGIDVSKWQGDIDWSKVAAHGVKFAMIKCGGRSTGSDGELYEDSKFEQNIQGALANGIQVGIYFFSQAVSVEEAYQEASMCINLIKKYQITYPVAFNWESADGYRVNSYGMDPDKLTKICEVFCDTVALNGYQPMVYFSRNDWYNAVNGTTLTSKYKTWLAVYFSSYYYTSQTYQYGDALPNFRYNYHMWQYGVTNTVPGIDGYVDMNIAFFTYSNYQINGLQPAKLEIPAENVSIMAGEGYDFMNGVKGTNSIGYDEEVYYIVTDGDGNEIAEEEVLQTPGVYTVEYSFKDPKDGVISKKLILTVTEKPTEIPTDAQTETETETYVEEQTESQTETYVEKQIEI